MMIGVFRLLYFLIAAVCFIVGGYFIVSAGAAAFAPTPTGIDPALLGMQRLESMFGGSGYAALGSGLVLMSLTMVVFWGVLVLRGQNAARLKVAEEQAAYLRYLAERTRAASKSSASGTSP